MPNMPLYVDMDGTLTPSDTLYESVMLFLRKSPLNLLRLLAWLALGLSQRLVGYYALHPPRYSSAIAQSIATALKTLIVGMSFLATFSFAFIALGLALVFLRSLVPGSASSAGEVEKTP